MLAGAKTSPARPSELGGGARCSSSRRRSSEGVYARARAAISASSCPDGQEGLASKKSRSRRRIAPRQALWSSVASRKSPRPPRRRGDDRAWARRSARGRNRGWLAAALRPHHRARRVGAQAQVAVVPGTRSRGASSPERVVVLGGPGPRGGRATRGPVATRAQLPGMIAKPVPMRRPRTQFSAGLGDG
jgi:hypothetical protein